MSDEFENREWVRLGVAGSLARQYALDQRSLLPLLASLLESAAPNETTVLRRGGLFSKKIVCGVKITLNDLTYTMEDPGRGAMRAERVHVVRGIALKTEQIPVEEWVEEVSEHLEQRAATSAAARNAMERLIS